MKKTKWSFLFFCLVLLNTIGVFNINLRAQNAQDSTSIYYKSILEIKDVSLTSKAFDFFNKKAEIALNQKDSINAAYYLELIALGQFKMGFTHDSELTAVQAYALIDNMRDKTETIEPRKRLNNQLGMIYRKISDYDHAITFYNQALELNDNLTHKVAILNNIANTYADTDNYKKAVDVLMPFYDKVLALDNTSIKAIYLDNLGFYQSKIGEKAALKNMELSLKIKMDLEDKVALFSSYRHLSLFYLEANNKTEAIKYSKKMTELSDQIDSPIFKLEAMELQLKLQDNPDFTSYLKLAKEIEHKKQLQENNYAAIKYNYEEKEKEARKLQLQIKDSQIKAEKEKFNSYIIQSVAVFGLLVSVLFYFLINAKHKKDKLQQVYNTEVRISKKVHDEVANDIYHIMTMLQENNTVKNDILDDLEGVYNKTRDISKENSLIDVNNDFENHLKDLLLSYKSEQVNIITKNINKVNWNSLNETKKIALYRVLQELMTNMRKHSQATLVVLTFNQNKQKTSIAYKDNGLGCNLTKHNGLTNTENRIESVNGTITFDSQINKGFSVQINV
ncbi:tetratricopeptide repeat-containing sensor histidine kinase [Yeosuana sp. AK3]